MDFEMPFFIIWSPCIKRLVHHAVYCMSLSCLLSFLCNPYNNLSEIFHLLVSVKNFLLLLAVTAIKCNNNSLFFTLIIMIIIIIKMSLEAE